jgi:hypothetical protein
MYDVKCLLALYKHFRKSKSPEEMAYMTQQPVLLSQVTFGKYRGTPWNEVPRDYLKWITKNEFDEDTTYTAHYYLTD